MNCERYNEWRRDIAAEYVLTTGRTFPKMVNNPPAQRLLVRLSDTPNPPSPEIAIKILQRKGHIK
jgi:hypothetical protein